MKNKGSPLGLAAVANPDAREDPNRSSFLLPNSYLRPVLVVEDDEDQREIVCDMLELEGYSVVLARDGEEALHMAQTIRPAAIILDVLLSRADGWEVLHRLKSDDTTVAIPVLIISVVDQLALGKRLGADDYMIKPLDPPRLRSAIRRLTWKAVGSGKRTKEE